MITEDQARVLIRSAFKQGKAIAYREVHDVIGSHMEHADSAAELKLLDALGHATLKLAERL